MHMYIHIQKNAIHIPHIHSRLSTGQGTAKPLVLWLKTPNCRSPTKESYAEASCLLIINYLEQYIKVPTITAEL